MKDLLFQKIVLKIRDLSSDGDGIGSYEGFTFFVPKALIGETVEVKVKKIKKNYGIAKVVRWLEKSQDRNIAKCPYFGKCGGCQLMHLTYKGQLFVKSKRIQGALRKNLLIDPENEIKIHPSKAILHYRNKVQMPFSMDQGKLSLSLYAKGSHDNVPIKACLIHNKFGESILSEIINILESLNLRPYQSHGPNPILRHLLIKTAINQQKMLIVLITHSKPIELLKRAAEQIMAISPLIQGVVHHENIRSDNVILDEKFTLLVGQSYIEETLSDLKYRISAPSFFQVNPLQAEKLYQKAVELGKISSNDIVIDAYCGIGSLSLFLAKKAKEVIGLEYVPRAIEDAKYNALLNDLKNLQWFAGDVKDLLPKFQKADLVYLNPPRKGCDKEVLSQVKALNPKKIIYISCDPMTLSRDAKFLCENGYDLKHVEGFDMFPQTTHVETLAQFVRSCEKQT